MIELKFIAGLLLLIWAFVLQHNRMKRYEICIKAKNQTIWELHKQIEEQKEELEYFNNRYAQEPISEWRKEKGGG